MFPKSTKVLIIDDMMTMRKIVSRACKRVGFENLVEAADGALGWEQINAADPQFGLIISDWNMPNCTGIDLLHRVRKSDKYSNTPFVLLTAEREAEQVNAAIKTGVDSFISKPFTQEVFEEKLKEAHHRCFVEKLRAGA